MKNFDRRVLVIQLLPWLLLAVALILVFSRLKHPSGLINVYIPWFEAGILAVIMTPIILTGGIDLSVGSIVALCSVVLGVLWREANWPIEAAVVAAVVAGCAAGMMNGLLVVVGLSPLVATLATMAFYAGLAMTVCGSERISPLPDSLLAWSTTAAVPLHAWIFGVVLAVTYVVVHHCRFGRYLFAMGDNPSAARAAAVPVKRTLFTLYALSGLVAGVVAVAYTVHNQASIPNAVKGIELKAITCVVVGGTLITGGQGGIGRTLLGIAVVAHLDIGLEFLGAKILNAEGRLIVVGSMLIAIAIWTVRARRQRADGNVLKS